MVRSVGDLYVWRSRGVADWAGSWIPRARVGVLLFTSGVLELHRGCVGDGEGVVCIEWFIYKWVWSVELILRTPGSDGPAEYSPG